MSSVFVFALYVQLLVRTSYDFMSDFEWMKILLSRLLFTYNVNIFIKIAFYFYFLILIKTAILLTIVNLFYRNISPTNPKAKIQFP